MHKWRLEEIRNFAQGQSQEWSRNDTLIPNWTLWSGQDGHNSLHISIYQTFPALCQHGALPWLGTTVHAWALRIGAHGVGTGQSHTSKESPLSVPSDR